MVIDFNDGLNVITGETGAGKSLIIKSMELLLGQQASDSYIYPDQESAYIEAIFKIPSSFDLDFVDTSEGVVMVSRTIKRGRSTINKINGESVPLKALKAVMEKLAFITSQHQVYQLLDSSNHMLFFDRYVGPSLDRVKMQYDLALSELLSLRKELQCVNDRNVNSIQELNELDELITDIDSQQFSLDEEQTLTDQRNELQVLQSRRKTVNAIVVQTNQVIDSLSAIDNHLTDLSDTSHSISFDAIRSIDQFRDIQQIASKHLLDIEYLESVDIEELNQRLDIIFKYRFKYNVNTLSELLELKETSIKRKHLIESNTDSFQSLKKKVQFQENEVQKLADELTQIRRSAQQGFEFVVLDQLKQLGMVDASFKVHFSTRDTFGSEGVDQIEFLFTANPNIDLKPLRLIASGGELSRVLLALLVSNDFILRQPLVVFDEIDVGIGGLTANYIASMMAKLAANNQLIVVTHLAQIARHANHHFKIEKTTQSNESCVTISLLKKDDVTNEIQRMVGGEVVASLIK